MLLIGRNCIRLSSIDSTNSYAIQLIENNKPEEGTVIMTDFQYQGRGQRETVWESQSGKNLLASFIFYPEIPVSDHFLFNQCIALSVYAMIKHHLGNTVKIKWPNDVLVKDKKIGGILIENSIRGNHFLYAVTGIGVNVNQQDFKKFSPAATSFFLETNKIFLINELLDQLSQSLNKWYLKLVEEDYEVIQDAYANALYQMDEVCLYEIAGEKILATIKGVNEDGRLLLEKQNGELLKLNFKEVKYLFI